MSFTTSVKATPSQRTSKRLQRVTQCMSAVTAVMGECENSSQVRRNGRSTIPGAFFRCLVQIPFRDFLQTIGTNILYPFTLAAVEATLPRSSRADFAVLLWRFGNNSTCIEE